MLALVSLVAVGMKSKVYLLAIRGKKSNRVQVNLFIVLFRDIHN